MLTAIATRSQNLWHSRCDLLSRPAGTQQRVTAKSHTQRNARRRRAGGIAMNFITHLRAFIKNDEGQDLLEYALLVALIALVAVGAVTAAGTSVKTIFTSIAGSLSGAAA